MKSIFATLMLAASALTSINAQNSFEGKWSGTLKIQAVELGLIFNLQQSGEGWTATMDSPNQGAKGISVKEVRIVGDSIFLNIPDISFAYSGKKIDDAHIIGSFTQYGKDFDLNLNKGDIITATKKKPQEPEAPYPYYTEDVNFTNQTDKVTLSGTLSMPKEKGSFPAVILVSGSGPQDRDEALLGHKPFLVLADYLTRQGFAVLRYDDRGFGKSTGNFSTSNSSDFARDAYAAVQYLKTRKEINKKKIGVIGHSEGGMIATKLAAAYKDVAFIVLLAGPGMSGDQILLQQQEVIGKSSGAPDTLVAETIAANKKIFDIIKSSKDTAVIRSRVTTYLSNIYNDGLLPAEEGKTKEEVVLGKSHEILSPWIIYFIQYDPQVDLKLIKQPVLALIGSKDCQVIAKYNLPALKTALEHNKKARVLEMVGLNHLFQTADTGMPEEYATIEETMSTAALETISEWLKSIN
jgi:pimeloyl-ACP methyl ester carboxylesterase